MGGGSGAEAKLIESQVNSRIYTIRFDDKEREESRMTFRFLVRKTG